MKTPIIIIYVPEVFDFLPATPLDLLGACKDKIIKCFFCLYNNYTRSLSLSFAAPLFLDSCFFPFFSFSFLLVIAIRDEI